MHPILSKLDIPYYKLNLTDLKRILTPLCRQIREDSGHHKYISIFSVNELDRQFSLISHCGLQPDIHARIHQGTLSFNRAWTDQVIHDSAMTRLTLKPGENQLAKQLDAVFGPHKPLVYSCIIAKVSDHEYMVVLEVNHHELTQLVFESISDSDIQSFVEKLYFATLKLYKANHISDWEKAVHELASPLDFIYSNSDFLIHYLLSAEVSTESRRKKLEDLRLVADLLLKRLHTFRFAFAGSNTLATRLTEVNLYETLMPITHLWYHESLRKEIRFVYDELRHFKVITDIDALQFIAFNLISNAIKYSKRGQNIELYAKEDPRENKIIFGVRNYGIPIAEEDVFRIFELGYRSEAALKADSRGLGVGLSVCKSLAHEIDGSISCTNISGSPTVFELQLPKRK